MSDDKTRIQAEPAKVTVGTQLSGIYELDEHLASGGMGEVYRGHNIQTGDLVAIKIVLPEFARDQTILQLFRKEASILNHLSHDAIVRYHVFTIDPVLGRPYLAMEFVNGESLFDVMRRGPMELPEIRRLCLRLASALAAVHEEHVFHRDLSPDNVVLPGGRVERAKIIDFGIARSAKTGEGTLIGGRFAGKYNYVSPEQLGLFGGEVSEQSDIYSLGLVLAAVALGRPLDMSGSQWEVVEKRRSVPDLSGVDASLAPLLEAMLQPDPADRPAMADIVDWIKAAMADDHGGTIPPERVSSPPRAMPAHAGASGRPVSAPPLHTAQSGAPPAFVQPVRPAHLAPAEPSPARPGQPRAADFASGQPRSRAGLVAAGSLALLALAGAGVFFSGILEAPRRPPLNEIAVQPRTDVAANPPPAAGTGETREPDKSDVSASSQPAAPNIAPTSPANAPVAPTAPPQAPAVAASPPPTVQPGASPPSGAQEQVAAAVKPTNPASARIDAVAERISWLRDYSGGDCFYAAATAATDSSMDIEGFGTQVEPFMAMLKDFQGRFGIEPDVDVRLIDPPQCPVTAFLRGFGAREDGQSDLVLERTTVPSGQPVSGAVQAPAGSRIALLLIDHKGMAFNLDGRLARLSDRATFSVPIGLSAGDDASGSGVPQVMIAIVAGGDIAAAKLAKPTPATEVLPAILAEIEQKKLTGSATAKYFRLSR